MLQPSLPSKLVGVGAPLPSGEAADHLIAGASGAIVEVAISTAGRIALIAGGLYLAGFGKKDIVRGSVAGALAIEVFVLGWAALTADS